MKHPFDPAISTTPSLDFQIERLETMLHWIEEHIYTMENYRKIGDEKLAQHELDNLKGVINDAKGHFGRLTELLIKQKVLGKWGIQKCQERQKQTPKRPPGDFPIRIGFPDDDLTKKEIDQKTEQKVRQIIQEMVKKRGFKMTFTFCMYRMYVIRPTFYAILRFTL